MRDNRTYRRKLLNFSIKREMQYRMIGKIFLLLFASLLLSSLIFFFFANREVTSSYQMFHVKAHNFLDFLLPVIAGSFVISLVAGAVGSLFFPKPIVGGVYRIEKELQKVTGEGDLTVQIKLRGGDQVVSLATEINTLISHYRERISGIDRTLQQLEGCLADQTAAGSRADRQTARQACVQLRSDLRRLNF